MNIKMMNDNILCVLSKSETKGLIMAKNYNSLEVVESSVEGVKKGDILYTMLNRTTDLTIEGKNYNVVNKRDIILVM